MMAGVQKEFGVSVVVPSYNRQALLLRAVESVSAPAAASVEIIVVDDASTLDPRLFLPAVNSHGVPIRIYRQHRNGGPQAARNLGIRRARFHFVAFLDSDDTFVGDKVAVLLRRLQAEDVDVLFHAVKGVERNNRLARQWRRMSGVLPFRWLLAFYNPVPTPALVFRRERRLGPASMRHCEDYAFLLHYCHARTRVDYLDEALSAVERPQGSSGGLSAAVWKMRKGEFRARGLLLRSARAGDLARWCVGGIVGCVRILNDVIRGRYLRRGNEH